MVGWGRGGKSSFTPAQSVCVVCVCVCMRACVHAYMHAWRGGGGGGVGMLKGRGTTFWGSFNTGA